MHKKSSSKKETTLGERMKQLRRERNWTQGELGEKIDSHVQTIARYEKDSVIPTATVLKKMAEVFGVTADYLIFGEIEDVVSSKVHNKELFKRFQQLDRVNPDEIKDLLGVMDVYIQKNAVKELVAAD